MAAIEIKGLTKYYGRTRGIEDLDLEVKDGEVFGFLGPNGAGKTTTIRLLLGLIRPDGGTASIFGTPLDFRSHKYREHVGYLPGEPGFYSHVSGNEFLTRMASLRHGKGMQKAERLAKLLDLDLSRKIKGLSHGTLQKLAIVQAFMHDARLLILDEPTSGLDPLAQQAFYELIHNEREEGKTIFMSSHVLSEVERTCSRVGVIREGRLAAIEEINDLKKKRKKWVEVEFGDNVDPGLLKIPGVKTILGEGRKFKLSVEGNFSEVLQALSTRRIENIVIHDATLEEIFLEYYTGRGGGSE